MGEIKINPLFNVHEKYREVIIINPYRFSDPDAVAQAARITAAGHTVVDFARMNLVISTLKSMGVYQYCKLLNSADFGVGKDPSTGSVSKLYDISGNNNDAVGIGTSQPIWSLVNGRGVITYDGVNDYLSAPNVNLGLNNTTKVSALARFKTTSTTGRIFQKQIASGANTVMFMLSSGKVQSEIINLAGNKYPDWFSPTINDGNLKSIAFVYDAILYNSTDGKIYINGVSQAVTFAANSYAAGFVIGENSNNFVIGVRPISFSDPFNGQINSSTIFNIALTQSQITQLYNVGL